jgi:hypothetical protein
MAKMRACLCLKPVPFGGELSREDFEQSWVHEPLTQSVHNCRLERIPADRQAIRANRLALVACGRATEMRLADLGEAMWRFSIGKNRSLSAGLPGSITRSRIKPLRPVVRLSLWPY